MIIHSKCLHAPDELKVGYELMAQSRVLLLKNSKLPPFFKKWEECFSRFYEYFSLCKGYIFPSGLG